MIQVTDRQLVLDREREAQREQQERDRLLRQQQEDFARVVAFDLYELLVSLDRLRKLLADLLDVLKVSFDVLLEHIKDLLALRLDVDRFEFAY